MTEAVVPQSADSFHFALGWTSIVFDATGRYALPAGVTLALCMVIIAVNMRRDP